MSPFLDGVTFAGAALENVPRIARVETP